MAFIFELLRVVFFFGLTVLSFPSLPTGKKVMPLIGKDGGRFPQTPIPNLTEVA